MILRWRTPLSFRILVEDEDMDIGSIVVAVRWYLMTMIDVGSVVQYRERRERIYKPSGPDVHVLNSLELVFHSSQTSSPSSPST